MVLLPLPLFLAKMYTLAQLTVCPLPDAAPHVDFQFLPEKPIYITEAPSAALGAAMKGNVDSTIATDSRWKVGGLEEGPIEPEFHMQFETVNDGSSICIFLSNIQFTLHYRPTIFIAKENKPLECRFKVVKLHEERHVATDLKTINEYVPKLQMELLWYLRSLGMQGPFPMSQRDTQIQEMAKNIGKALRPIVGKLIDTRRARQGMIDTVENYKHESSLCPGEFPSIEELEKEEADTPPKP